MNTIEIRKKLDYLLEREISGEDTHRVIEFYFNEYKPHDDWLIRFKENYNKVREKRNK